MFHNTLKKIRLDNRYSQQAIADYLNISRATYANYERGARTPSLEAIVKLATFFNTTTDFLLEHSLEPDSKLEVNDNFSQNNYIEQLTNEDIIKLLVNKFNLDILSEKFLIKYLSSSTYDRTNFITALQSMLDMDTKDYHYEISQEIDKFKQKKKETI